MTQEPFWSGVLQKATMGVAPMLMDQGQDIVNQVSAGKFPMPPWQ